MYVLSQTSNIKLLTNIFKKIIFFQAKLLGVVALTVATKSVLN